MPNESKKYLPYVPEIVLVDELRGLLTHHEMAVYSQLLLLPQESDVAYFEGAPLALAVAVVGSAGFDTWLEEFGARTELFEVVRDASHGLDCFQECALSDDAYIAVRFREHRATPLVATHHRVVLLPAEGC